MDSRLFMEAKTDGFNIRRRKSLIIKPNNNSADFITPNFSYGCEAACAYCYTARHNKFGNPMTVSENTDELLEAIVEHYYTLESKYPDYSNQQDRWQWVYDVGML